VIESSADINAFFAANALERDERIPAIRNQHP
jgi:hypothetical protein